MINFDSEISSIVDIACQYQPPKFYKYLLVCKYYYGFQEGPDSYWLDEDDLEVGWDNELIRRISEFYLDNIGSRMEELHAKGEANVFEIVAIKNSAPSYRCYMVDGQEEDKELEIKGVLGDEYYDELKRRSELEQDEENGTSENELEDVQHELTAEELFAHLYHTATKDLKGKWKEVSIEFQFALRDGARELSAIYCMEDERGEKSQYEPSEVFGPLNAMAKLREMAAEQGDAYEHAVFRLSSKGSISIDVSQ